MNSKYLVKVITNEKILNEYSSFTLIAMNLFSLGNLSNFNKKNSFFWLDGIAGVIYTKFKNPNISAKKIPGPELLRNLIKRNSFSKVTIIGNAPEKFIQFMKDNDVSLVHHYKVPDFKESSVDEFSEVTQDIIFSLPAPVQEIFATQLQEKFNHTLRIYCFGGALQMIHDPKLEANNFIRSIGMEWLWRLRTDTFRRINRLIKSIFILFSAIPYLVKSKIDEVEN